MLTWPLRESHRNLPHPSPGRNEFRINRLKILKQLVELRIRRHICTGHFTLSGLRPKLRTSPFDTDVISYVGKVIQ